MHMVAMTRKGQFLGMLAIVLGCAPGAFAQATADRAVGVHVDTLHATQKQPFALKPWIIVGTESVESDGVTLPATAYRFDYRLGQLWFIDAPPDTFVVSYRTYPFSFRPAYFNRRLLSPEEDTSRVRTLAEVDFLAERPPQETSIFGDSKLERHGSITRGITAGNNRDVSLESGLRIQLAGEITDGVNVRAVLTDESTPIQPDGTTQRLNEFDRVFMQIETRGGTATLGDYDLRFGSTEFARLSRKLQGISLTNSAVDPAGSTLGPVTATLAGATSRGIFNSFDVTPIEGVQGPYRLPGREGERFIIVIAGTERVYMDGQLLTRGETQDYVIDYSTGEVTFTSRRLVSEDRRITVEYEYTTNRFTRSMIATEANIGLWQRTDGSSRAKLGATFLREADSRSVSDEIGLSPSDSLALVMAGDGAASVPGGELVPFDPEASYVQYIRQDTLFAGVTFTIFVPLTDTAATDSVYRVRFTQVTQGSGDYIRSGSSLNGILFEWVGPARGDYIAERLLPKPKEQRLLDLTGSFEPTKGVEVYGEWARSVNDANRFSTLDSQDDDGGAYNVGFRVQPTPVELGTVGLGRWSAGFRNRHTGRNFEAFVRTRPVEFKRQWNLTRGVSATGSSGGASEDVSETYLQVDLSKATRVRADYGRLSLGGGFAGTRLAFEGASAEPRKPNGQYRMEIISSEDALIRERGEWIRQFASFSQGILGGRVTPGIEVEHEDRKQRPLDADSLLKESQTFVEVRPKVSYATEKTQVEGFVEYRTEKAPLDGTLADRSSALSTQVRVGYQAGRSFNTQAEIGYRKKRFTEQFADRGEKTAESIVVQSTSRFGALRRALQGNAFYEVVTERTPLLQETYVRTGPEIGQFVWEDFNGDGIRQVDEFIPERTPFEGTYVRTFLPSDNLESVINLQTRLRLDMNPALMWRRPENLVQELLSQVYSQTTVEIAEKSTEDQLSSIYLLDLSKFRSPETTLNGRLRLEERLELFRSVRTYGLILSVSELKSLSRLSAGTEDRSRTTWRATGRYRFAPAYNFSLTTSYDKNRTLSEEFASRTFDLKSVSFEPELSVALSEAFHTVVGVAYSRKEDRHSVNTQRRATVWKFPVEARYGLAGRLQISGRMEVSSVDLQGEAVGYAAFELTDGRGPGTAYLWNVTGNYVVTQLIRSSFSYDGRAPSGAPTIHTVRVQFSLVF